MFAKVFEQIFDSSIAQDYTVRHMFIDLLILADPTGAVDMTPDAIARRTNVPTETVLRCLTELCQPDVKSRSPLEDGKRLVPLDSHRDWGWKIVNYHHYRKIRDQEARRSYFRDYQRKRRKKLKVVKDTEVDNGDAVEFSTSSSISSCVQKKFKEWIEVRKAMGKAPKSWNKMFNEQIKWLTKFSDSDQLEIVSQSIRNNWQGLFEVKRNKQTMFSKPSGAPAAANGLKPDRPIREPTDEEREAQRVIIQREKGKLNL